MCFDYRRNCRKAQPSAKRLGGDIRVEKAPENVRTDARTIVGNRKQHTFSSLEGGGGTETHQFLLRHHLSLCGDDNSPRTLADRLNRVFNNVHEHLEQLITPGVNGRKPLWDIQLEIHRLGKKTAKDSFDIINHLLWRFPFENDARLASVIH